MDGKPVKEGEYVSFDGLKGEIKLGKMASKPSEILQVVNGQLESKKSDIYQRFNRILECAVRAPSRMRERRPSRTGGSPTRSVRGASVSAGPTYVLR